MSLAQYLILHIEDHVFATTVSNIEDVIKKDRNTPVPLAPSTISGVLNLRGYIVTEIDVAETLKIPTDTTKEEGFAVVISRKDELYSLAFQSIGDVLEIDSAEIAPLPETLQKNWHQLSKGVYRLEDQLVVILDLELFIEQLLENDQENNSEPIEHA